MNVTLLVAVAIRALSDPSFPPLSFDDALLNKQITASAMANDGSSHYQQPILLEIKNITAAGISVELPVGRYFQSADTTDQNFVSTQPVSVALAPGEKKSIPVSAMCVNHHKGAPLAGQVYAIRKSAKEKLLRTAQYIHRHQLFGSYLGQTVMWCVSDNQPLEDVFSYREDGVNQALKFLSDLTGKPIPPPPAPDDYLRNPGATPKISIGGSFEFSFSKPKAIHIAMFNEQNIAVRELYNNPSEPPGKHTIDFEFDGSVFNDGKYYIRFLCDNTILMEQEMDL